MSYLHMAAGMTAFSQAIMSFWFRVPQKSLDACRAVTGDSPLKNVIPLVCLEPAGTGKTLEPPATTTAAVHTYFQFTEGGAVVSETDLGFTPTSVPIGPATPSDTITKAPTCIGVSCPPTGVPALFINLQTNKKAAISGASYEITSLVPATSYAGATNPGWPPGPNVDAIYDWTDNSAAAMDETECFVGSDAITITADHWHHVLLSFQLRNVTTTGNWPASIAANTSSAARMWLALDDKNYTRFDLSDYWPDGSSDPNAIITPHAKLIAVQAPHSGGTIIYNSTDPANYGVFHANDVPAGTASFSLAGPTIPGQKPIGLPSTTRFVDDIFNVEMAEFQMWTGITLDTGSKTNRRAFVDDRGKPVQMSKAEKLTGKKPAIKLHGSGAWIKGRNSGSIGIDPQGKPIKAGQFTPVAVIKRYRPNPSLHGPQKPGEKAP